MIKNITIGADPELFLKNDEDFVSAEGKFGGTKESPKLLERKGFAVQEDNVMVEFNIPPCDTLESFTDNLNYMLDYIQTGAKLFDCKIDKSASALFPLTELDTEQAQMFGCDPDYNCYTRDKNPSILIEDERLRTAGGHVHIGYDNPNEEDSIALIAALDITLGLPSLLKDLDTRRRSMYGKAGAYRLQPFGVEYRTLSNFWMFQKRHIKWVYDGVDTAVDLVNTGMIFEILESPFGMAVENVINSNDRTKASKLLTNISNLIKTKSVCVDY
jgi:hypothetical protein